MSTGDEKLLALTATNGSFSKEIPGLQIYWDSTSLGDLKTCAWKYYLSMIEGWEPNRMADPLMFGIVFHKALETYDKVKFSGATHDTAMLAAVRLCLCDTVETIINEETGEEELKFWHSEDNRRTRELLVRAVVWYLIEFENDPAETVTLANGKPAVELSFKFPTGIKTPTGEEYMIDRKSTRLNSSHRCISYAVFCLKKKHKKKKKKNTACTMY